MDGVRFDYLTRALSDARSRRHTITVFAGALSALGLASTGAKAKKKKKPCPPCKKGKCKGLQPAGTPCTGGSCDGAGTCLLAPSPPPSPPPPPVCPPVCPVCLGCNGATGQCEALPSMSGQSALGCAAPKICCAGSCCEFIHECNSAGQCATCTEVCPDNCLFCVSLANGDTRCAGEAGSACLAGSTCSTSADCPASHSHCVTSYTIRSTNQVLQSCGAVGSGSCYSLGPCA